ncbi:MAG: hypothetical protein HXP24_01410 [Veillonella sp.]|nr:hypothetical protein [Veillonella sp.]
MKLVKLLPIMAIAGVCFSGQANAAQDQLMMPEQASAPMTVNEQAVSLAVPSEEVKAVVAEFAAFQLGQPNTGRVSGQERLANNALYYMNVRRSWYITSHRYKKDSYARVALDRMYLDYKDFFKNAAVSGLSQAEYENQILAILEKNTENMNNNELRFYMNEMVIYSLKQAMRAKHAKHVR